MASSDNVAGPSGAPNPSAYQPGKKSIVQHFKQIKGTVITAEVANAAKDDGGVANILTVFLNSIAVTHGEGVQELRYSMDLLARYEAQAGLKDAFPGGVGAPDSVGEDLLTGALLLYGSVAQCTSMYGLH